MRVWNLACLNIFNTLKSWEFETPKVFGMSEHLQHIEVMRVWNSQVFGMSEHLRHIEGITGDLWGLWVMKLGANATHMQHCFHDLHIHTPAVYAFLFGLHSYGTTFFSHWENFYFCELRTDSKVVLLLVTWNSFFFLSFLLFPLLVKPTQPESGDGGGNLFREKGVEMGK